VTSNKNITMADLLKRSGKKIKSFTIGEKVMAKVVELGRSVALFDIGGKAEGILKDSFYEESKKFVSTLKPGDEVLVTVVIPETNDGQIVVSLRDTAANDAWQKLDQAKKTNTKITVTVKGITDSGLTAETESITGFIPMSQVGKKVLGDLDSFVGKRLDVKVVEVDQNKNRLVLSERQVSEADDIKKMDSILEKITHEDGVFEGEVVTLTKFGAFVEIKVKSGKSVVPVEGLVHISEISWEKTRDPKEVLDVGQKVKVRILGSQNLPAGRQVGKLALSMRQAMDDPWKEIDKKYKSDAKVKGKIVKKTDFGVFVQLEPGVEGLVHLTKIPPGTKMELGQDVNCYIEEVDPLERRISLGIVLTSKPIGYK